MENGSSLVITGQIQRARDILNTHYCLWIRGDVRHGKTVIAHVLMKDYAKTYECVALDDPSHLIHITHNDVKLVLIDDIENGKLWCKALNKLTALASKKYLKLIFISKTGVQLDFNNSCIFDLTDEDNDLLSNEKMHILQCMCASENRLISNETAQKCAASYSKCPGVTFIACCELFAKGFGNYKGSGERYFKHPIDIFLKRLRDMSKEEKQQLQDLVREGGVRKAKEKSQILPSLETSWILCEHLDNDEEWLFEYRFSHPVIQDAVLIWLCEINPIYIIQVAPLSFLFRRVRLTENLTDQLHSVVIAKPCWTPLRNRLKRAVIDNNEVDRVATHPVFTNERFVDEFFAGFVSPQEIEYFLTSYSTFIHHTFIRVLVHLSDSNLEYVLRKALELLHCRNDCVNNDTNDCCWKCQEKRRTLESSLQEQNAFAIDLLSKDEYAVTPRSIVQCIRHREDTCLQQMLKILKFKGVQEENPYIQNALELVNDASVFPEIATRNNLRNTFADNHFGMSRQCLSIARQKGTAEDVKTVIDMLKQAGKWDIRSPILREEIMRLLDSTDPELSSIGSREFYKNITRTQRTYLSELELD